MSPPQLPPPDSEPSGFKQTIYFPQEMRDEIVREAHRLDRSISWVVKQAWKIAYPRLVKFPGSEQ